MQHHDGIKYKPVLSPFLSYETYFTRGLWWSLAPQKTISAWIDLLLQEWVVLDTGAVAINLDRTRAWTAAGTFAHAASHPIVHFHTATGGCAGGFHASAAKPVRVGVWWVYILLLDGWPLPLFRRLGRIKQRSVSVVFHVVVVVGLL